MFRTSRSSKTIVDKRDQICFKFRDFNVKFNIVIVEELIVRQFKSTTYLRSIVQKVVPFPSTSTRAIENGYRCLETLHNLI